MIYGVGINDADYVVQPTINGKRVICPFYNCWANMLKRVYSNSLNLKRPTYKDVACSEDWILFSNFKKWMEKQPWKDCELDKDILFIDNKLYSESTCVFVPSFINNLFLDSGSIRGEYPLGVNFHKGVGKLCSQIKIENKKKHLGYFDRVEDAHSAWQVAKFSAMINAVSTWRVGKYPSFNETVAEAIYSRADRILDDAQKRRVTENF